MPRRPRLIGKWRIVETEVWDRDALDLVQPAFIEFRSDRTGEFCFIAVEGWLDCRYSSDDGKARVEFSWDGKDEYDDVSGRGWAAIQDDGVLRGRILFHLGEDSSFAALRYDKNRER
jgi:hypothetical protein